MVGKCSICDEILDSSHNQVQLVTCNHVFHIVCMIRWFEKLPAHRNTCPHCLDSMSINDMRIIQSDSSRNLDISTNTKSKSKQRNLMKCGLESHQSIIVANLEHELAELQAEKQRLVEERDRLKAESKRLEEENKRLEEENKRLEEENERLEEESERLQEERERLQEEMRGLEERIRFLEEQQRIEQNAVIALLLVAFIGLCCCLKYKFRFVLM